MSKDFYFAYGYDGKTATRLYRFVGGIFQRFDPASDSWKSDPGQSRIFIGEDLDYEEITENQARDIRISI